jgi:hypothetical protein
MVEISWMRLCQKVKQRNVLPFDKYIVNVYYVTNFGCIEGVLTVNSDVVLFDPSFVERNKALVSKCNSKGFINYF